jgi:N4-gp56 family major capsid protein
MAGQVWGTNSLGGHMYSDELSDTLRLAMSPLMRFRQFSFVEDAKGKNAGDLFHWNVYSDVVTAGAALTEGTAIPETNFTITQGTLTITERGNSVPFSSKLDDLSKQPVEAVIHKVLKKDANKAMETATHAQFDTTLLVVTAASGTSESAITVETGGAPTATNNVALGNTHVKLIVDELKERDVPTFDGSNYGAIGRPSTFRAFKDDLEPFSQYTDKGFGQMLNGEVGRHYDGVRFFEQTGIASEGWTNGKSDAVYFFGDDTVAEGIAIPEEIRGKIPTDYGRSRGVAWYCLNGFGIVHNQTGAVQNRIMKWDSAA